MKNLHIYGIGYLMIFSSCYSTLNVRVHSFDMAKMRSSNEYIEKRKKAEFKYYQALLQNSYFDNIKVQFNKKINDALLKLYNENKISDKARTDLQSTIKSKVDLNIENLRASTQKASDILESLIKTNSDAIEKEYNAAQSDFEMKKLDLLSFAQNLGSEIGNPNLNLSLYNNLKTTISAVAQSNTYGTSIADDDMASFVVKAPEQYWEKYKSVFYTDNSDLSKSSENSSINITNVTTLIGNSDIAVKMDGPGNFIIKGVRLDADQAFRTSFKVLSQGISYMTGASGLSTNSAKSTSTSTNTNTVTQVPELQNFNKNKQLSGNLNTLFQQLTDTFLKILDSYKKDLVSSDNTKRKAAIDAVKSAYTYYKSQLPIQ